MELYGALRERVFEANQLLARSGLAVLTWGNASEADRDQGVMAIKPSGVSYEAMRPQDMVVLSLESGEVVWGTLRPSSDTPTHVALYRAFGTVRGVAHSHSRMATAWAQAGIDVPCLGTTHADSFYGPVPCTRSLSEAEVEGPYEVNTGLVIAEIMNGRDPMAVPGALVRQHGPFTWGKDAMDAVHNAVILEEVAAMALLTLGLRPGTEPAPEYLLRKHFMRKHGPDAYYGQAGR